VVHKQPVPSITESSLPEQVEEENQGGTGEARFTRTTAVKMETVVNLEWNMGARWRWALVSPDGVAPSRMVSVSASVNLSLHHKVQKFYSGPAHPGGPGKRAVKRLCVFVW